MFGLLQRRFSSVIINGYHVSYTSVPGPKHRKSKFSFVFSFCFFTLVSRLLLKPFALTLNYVRRDFTEATNILRDKSLIVLSRYV